MTKNERRQGVFWMLTIPFHEFTPYLPPAVRYIKGQLERGERGYLHWQIMCAFDSKQSLRQVRSVFGTWHAELSRSSAGAAYVWKEESSVAGTRFELGVRPVERGAKRDWESVWKLAKDGEIEKIPADIRVVSYRTIRAIGADFSIAPPIARVCYVFWGPTGTGKSHRAWTEGGPLSYPKDPRSKFWSGYVDQEVVIIDEFRGGIDIAHILRWLDRYPCHVEIKGASRPLLAKKIYITSNLHPTEWYKDVDPNTMDALLRRLIIEELNITFTNYYESCQT